MRTVSVRGLEVGNGAPLTVIAGPCVIESEEMVMETAGELKELFSSTGCQLIFKSSYDKANRSSHSGFRGPGLKEGLRILARVKSELDLPVVTDVHTVEEAGAAGAVCDMLQIPAFLCRQTDLLAAAAETGAVVSVKKGQFLAPWDMKNVVEKLESAGCRDILCVERGASYGYNNLVSDMRAIPIMQQLGYPVCFDATHSVQLPGGQGTSSGGQREFIPVLAKAAIAAGADCLFMEAHPDPVNAKSDAASQIALDQLLPLVQVLEKLYKLVRS